MNKQTNDGVVREIIVSEITVDHVKDHTYKDDVLSCQLRQVVTKKLLIHVEQLIQNKILYFYQKN